MHRHFFSTGGISMLKNITHGVSVWEEDTVIPTYQIGKPDKNPMFLEKRVYQGSSGRVYPHSVIDKITDTKVDKTYHALFLENKYLFVMILPELGGRIQRAYDKTNHFDFVYYNHVIKPALVGLAGPWISGGIEFNWPQHHRPSTFDPVNYKIIHNDDGSCTVCVGEIENMFRTKGITSITLYPDKAYIELKTQLYNRTELPQTFLWWANPAVAVNDNTQSIFPPDVTAVMDHGKRDVSTFPIATGTYYKIDYSSGVDISRYKNIPVPTSYMAYHSDFDFVGGYDHAKKAGILHIADHHISPGKKQWTWGCGDFGKAWYRNLTDSDGPYVELMTGCFTDNQPDFSWLAPYEEKCFTQYFMPYKKVGMIQNANIHVAVNLELTEKGLHVAAYATSEYKDAHLIVRAGNRTCIDRKITISPENTYDEVFPVGKEIKISQCRIEIDDASGKEIIECTPKEKSISKIPDPAKEPPLPADVKSTEDLYLYGLHVEQYHHATYEASDYYLEGLRRDPMDIRLNNAYGLLLMRRGKYKEAQKYFETAVKKLTRSNPNPYDGEPYFNLGLSLKYQGKTAKAYDDFYKSTWNGAWQDAGFYQVACIDAAKGDFQSALEHVERSILRNYHSMKARDLKLAILRKLGLVEKAKTYAEENLTIDPLDFASLFELAQLAKLQNKPDESKKAMDGLYGLMNVGPNPFLEISIGYADAGMYIEAVELLSDYVERQKDPEHVYPMIYYYLSFYCGKCGDARAEQRYLRLAANACSDYCFPHRIEDILVLEHAIENNPQDAKAPYYLGNLWYDKKQYSEAISNWERSRKLDSAFATVHRNLALAYYNKRNDGLSAMEEMKKAFELNPKDSRVFMEYDQLKKKQNISPAERLKAFKQYPELVKDRDDLYVEYVTLLNLTGNYAKAKEQIASRNFHPWEGGEGKITSQYINCHVELAKEAIRNENYQDAITLLHEATVYPHNLGEGKLIIAQENNIYYFMGCAYEKLNDEEKAKQCFLKASKGLSEPAGMMYYNDQPPETIFYQGLAWLKLRNRKEADSRFHKLLAYGEKHFYDNVRIDYFAVSLPDLMIFDEDLCKKNRIHCLYMMALGHIGLGNTAAAEKGLNEVLQKNPNHLGGIIHLNFLHSLTE